MKNTTRYILLLITAMLIYTAFPINKAFTELRQETNGTVNNHLNMAATAEPSSGNAALTPALNENNTSPATAWVLFIVLLFPSFGGLILAWKKRSYFESKHNPEFTKSIIEIIQHFFMR